MSFFSKEIHFDSHHPETSFSSSTSPAPRTVEPEERAAAATSAIAQEQLAAAGAVFHPQAHRILIAGRHVVGQEPPVNDPLPPILTLGGWDFDDDIGSKISEVSQLPTPSPRLDAKSGASTAEAFDEKKECGLEISSCPVANFESRTHETDPTTQCSVYRVPLGFFQAVSSFSKSSPAPSVIAIPERAPSPATVESSAAAFDQASDSEQTARSRTPTTAAQIMMLRRNAEERRNYGVRRTPPPVRSPSPLQYAGDVVYSSTPESTQYLTNESRRGRATPFPFREYKLFS